VEREIHGGWPKRTLAGKGFFRFGSYAYEHVIAFASWLFPGKTEVGFLHTSYEDPLPISWDKVQGRASPFRPRSRTGFLR